MTEVTANVKGIQGGVDTPRRQSDQSASMADNATPVGIVEARRSVRIVVNARTASSAKGRRYANITAGAYSAKVVEARRFVLNIAATGARLAAAKAHRQSAGTAVYASDVRSVGEAT